MTIVMTGLVVLTMLLSGLRTEPVVTSGTFTATDRVYLPYLSLQCPEPEPPVPVLITGTIIVHYKPEYILTIDGHVSSDEPRIPLNGTLLWGEPYTRSITWPVGDFTGFYPTGDLGNFQRGVSENQYGSSAVQLQGYTAGLHVHSDYSRSGDIYKLAQVVYKWKPAVFPWGYGDKAKLCASYHTAVPNSWTGGGSINYAYSSFTIQDQSSEQILWIGMDHYDSRGLAQFAEMPIWWKEANAAIALGYFGGHRYSSLLPSSRESTGETWSDWRYYGLCISQDQLRTMLKEINDRFDFTFSTDPRDYRLLQFNVGPEINTEGGKQGHMSMKVKNIWVFTWIDEGSISFSERITMNTQPVLEFLKSLMALVWSYAGVKVIVGHVLVNVIVAVAAAQHTRSFDLSKLAEFLTQKLLPFVAVYTLCKAFGESAGLRWLAPAVWIIIEATLVGNLVDNLIKLGMPIPNVLARNMIKPQ